MMRHQVSSIVLSAGLLLVMAGCATNSMQSDVQQFSPVPRAEVGTRDLDPVNQRPVTDLLREADREFQLANEAHGNGEQETSVQHYTRMLELLVEANLDPAVFYSLRKEFSSIIESSSVQAKLYQPQGIHRPTEPGVYGEVGIPFPLPEQVLKEIERIQTGYPKNFQAALNRSHKYLPYIRSTFRQNGLPEELAWLVMVESQFTPKVVSRAGAGGMWQFMRETGQNHQLRVDSYVDHRYNWERSTHAAASYLKNLHDHFNGNWALAIAAYNMGEYGLERAVAANGGEQDFFRLIATPPASDRIKQETKDYYPRFLASWIVGSNPARYGFTVTPEIPDDLTPVSIAGEYFLQDLDEAMGLTPGTTARLNPDLIRERTPPTGEYPVMVPRQSEERLATALRSMPKANAAVASYRVRRGDTISVLAKRYSVSESDLMRTNKIRSARSLRVGQTIQIPGSESLARGGAVTEVSAPKQEAPVVFASAPAVKSYTVRPGDTLSEIAEAHGVTVRDLQARNDMGGRTGLSVGDKIDIGGATSSTGGNSAREHVVKPGEYPAKVAAQYKVAVNDLLEWNGLDKNAVIHIGDKLKVYASSGAAPSAAPSKKVTHSVASGENPTIIAKKYGVSTSDLLAWNNLTTRSMLRIGQKLEILAPGRTQVASNAPAAGSGESGRKVTHLVARGHNPTTIARRYGVRVSDLFKWNDWSSKHVLQVGDKVTVFVD